MGENKQKFKLTVNDSKVSRNQRILSRSKKGDKVLLNYRDNRNNTLESDVFIKIGRLGSFNLDLEDTTESEILWVNLDSGNLIEEYMLRELGEITEIESIDIAVSSMF